MEHSLRKKRGSYRSPARTVFRIQPRPPDPTGCDVLIYCLNRSG
jgi:hypothetical protein